MYEVSVLQQRTNKAQVKDLIDSNHLAKDLQQTAMEDGEKEALGELGRRPC